MKVKVFHCGDEKDLEKEMNDFIEKINKEHMEVKDIKYSSYCSAYGVDRFTALIMYGPKKPDILDIMWKNGVFSDKSLADDENASEMVLVEEDLVR